MPQRALIKLRTLELAQLAERGASERAQVIEELTHRRSGQARRLLEKLRSNGDSACDDASAAPGRAEAATHGGNTAEPVPRPKSVDRDLATRFEVLRVTFTLEGEILARWGMTPELPAEIEASAVSQWRELLSSTPDSRGRSLTTLDEDMRNLAAEREQQYVEKGERTRDR